MYVSKFDQALEILRSAHPTSVHVKDLAIAIGDETSQQLSTALSKALSAGDPRIARVDRGVYRWVQAPESEVTFETGKTLDEHVAEIEAKRDDETAEEPSAPKEAGRIRRVRQRIKDLEGALDDLSFYMTKIEAKARAYDKMQYVMNGVVVDPL